MGGGSGFGGREGPRDFLQGLGRLFGYPGGWERQTQQTLETELRERGLEPMSREPGPFTRVLKPAFILLLFLLFAAGWLFGKSASDDRPHGAPLADKVKER
jgi:hypothetical protein